MASPLSKINISKMELEQVIGVQVQKENIELFLRVKMEERLQNYCNKTGQNYEHVASIFFDDTPFQECYCKGMIIAKGVRCHRVAKRGTNYCGFHQDQGKKRDTMRPPKRMTPRPAAPQPSAQELSQLFDI